MKLSELCNGIGCCQEGQGGLDDKEIIKVTCDSRDDMTDAVFVCIAGQKFDGHTVAEQALENGAAAVVVQRDLGLEKQILVENTREAYAILCGNFQGNPAAQMKLIGITGTNGKTTVTYLVKHILEHAGKQVGLIGTIHNEIGEMDVPATHTTPDPAELHVLFRRMRDAGCEYVVMEVSSHALDQRRLAGCRFSVAVFTNLTQDHLDYHGSMEEYYQAKKRLFLMSDCAVINADDAYAQRLMGEIKIPYTTFSTRTDRADYTAKDIHSTAAGSRFAVLGSGVIGRVQFCTPGRFSVENAMAAGTAALVAGTPFETMVAGLCSSSGVVGRFEVLPTGTDYTVLRDYAHSPDGLEKMLLAVREFAHGRVITLFGCAGNRDRSKRAMMGEIVSRFSDFVILTSDNPRDEDPLQIIEDARPGLLQHKTPYKIMPDRYEAIEWALDFAREGDILILAGKGHEDYQVLQFGTICFDEREVVQRLLDQKKQRSIPTQPVRRD